MKGPRRGFVLHFHGPEPMINFDNLISPLPQEWNPRTVTNNKRTQHLSSIASDNL